MPIAQTVTTITEVWEEGDWSRSVSLSQLEQFVKNAKIAGFGDEATITINHGKNLEHIMVSKTVKE